MQKNVLITHLLSCLEMYLYFAGMLLRPRFNVDLQRNRLQSDVKTMKEHDSTLELRRDMGTQQAAGVDLNRRWGKLQALRCSAGTGC